MPPPPARHGQPLLTVIVPAFNEGATIGPLLERVVAAPYDKQIVVVDDASTDGTADILDRWNGRDRVEVARHEANRGKGRAIRTGLALARGRFTIIQDADLEYDPDDYPKLIEPLIAGKAQAVFGSRYLERPRRGGSRLFRWGVGLLNVAVRQLYGVTLSDEATCYKALPTELWRQLDLQCERFEFCPEVTAKLCRLRIDIVETAISYRPRSAEDGKKIRWRDGVSALRELWKWRGWRPDGNGHCCLGNGKRSH